MYQWVVVGGITKRGIRGGRSFGVIATDDFVRLLRRPSQIDADSVAQRCHHLLWRSADVLLGIDLLFALQTTQVVNNFIGAWRSINAVESTAKCRPNDMLDTVLFAPFWEPFDKWWRGRVRAPRINMARRIIVAVGAFSASQSDARLSQVFKHHDGPQ